MGTRVAFDVDHARVQFAERCVRVVAEVGPSCLEIVAIFRVA